MSLEDRVNELEKINTEGFKVPKRFYCRKKDSKSKTCCFNHWLPVGLPVKNGIKHEIYDYELDIIEMLEKHRQILLKKCTGIGATEIMMRWIAFKALTEWNKSFSNVIIITGPRIELSITLIERLKKLFDSTDFETKNTRIEIGRCRVEAYPSYHFASARGLTDVKLVYIDEADFIIESQRNEAIAIADRYLAKSNNYSILVSTPNLPGGLFDRMEHGENPHYFKIFLPYTVGLGKIFTKEEIELAKKSPSFEREYNLSYISGEGNIFPYDLLHEVIEAYDLKVGNGQRLLCCDPAYSSSMFAILGIEKIQDIAYIKEAIQIERASPSAMTDLLVIKAKDYSNTVYCDSAHPGLIRDLVERGINAQPINFRESLSEMTIQSAQAVKEKTVRIHPAFKALIAQLSSITYNDKGYPDKKRMNFDLGDAFMMSIHKIKTSRLFIIKV